MNEFKSVQTFSWGYLSILQLLAAFAVMYSHSYPLASGNGAGALIMDDAIPWGTAAVNVFLLISGFMVCASFGEYPDFSRRFFEMLRFCIKRIIRIVPVIWIATLLALFVVGPLFTTYSLHEYFRSGLFWEYTHALDPFVAKFFLPGVFEQNLNHGVNGSLWVIPWQMWCYVVVAVVGLRGLHHNRTVVTILCSVVGGLYFGQDRFIGDARFAGLPLAEGIRLVFYFMAGWTWRVWSPIIKPKMTLAGGLLLTLPLWLVTPARDIALAVIGGYFLVALVSLPKWHAIECTPRISFGVFVFGFMVQQCFVSAWGGCMNNWLNFVLSLLVTVPLAFIELYVIEKPASRIRVWLLGKIDSMEKLWGLSKVSR